MEEKKMILEPILGVTLIKQRVKVKDYKGAGETIQGKTIQLFSTTCSCFHYVLFLHNCYKG